MNLLKGLSLPGLAIGAGVVLLAPVLIPAISGALKPLLKNTIKGGILAYEGAKLAVAETREALEDITAEAKAEVSQKNSAPKKAAAKK
ncbi:MAG: DUF5132 domain-containing protein [Pseudomonadota bacterium]